MMQSFPISYQEPIFRPPSEADSILLPVTIGCSHNKCTYCAMYQTKRYRERAWEEIESDLKALRTYFNQAKIVPRSFFFCDGDAMNADTSLLVRAASLARELFLPHFDRISLYANVMNVLKKSREELISIRESNINLAYIGMESGWDPLLSAIGKGHDAAQLIAACQALRGAGFKISLIVMIGLAGAEGSDEHAAATAKALSAIVPDYLSFLVTTPIPGTPYQRQIEKGMVKPLTSHGIFTEMSKIIGALVLPKAAKIVFRANHVSNLMPLRGELPRDTTSLTAILADWIKESPRDASPPLNPLLL